MHLHYYEKYGLIEKQYFCLLHNFMEQNGRGGHNRVEYILTVDAAKELSMVEGNVLQAIRNLFDTAQNCAVQKWFYESTFFDAQGKKTPDVRNEPGRLKIQPSKNEFNYIFNTTFWGRLKIERT